MWHITVLSSALLWALTLQSWFLEELVSYPLLQTCEFNHRVTPGQSISPPPQIGWVELVSWWGASGLRTTCLGGNLLLGDSWSSHNMTVQGKEGLEILDHFTWTLLKIQQIQSDWSSHFKESVRSLRTDWKVTCICCSPAQQPATQPIGLQASIEVKGPNSTHCSCITWIVPTYEHKYISEMLRNAKSTSLYCKFSGALTQWKSCHNKSAWTGIYSKAGWKLLKKSVGTVCDSGAKREKLNPQKNSGTSWNLKPRPSEYQSTASTPKPLGSHNQSIKILSVCECSRLLVWHKRL